MRSTGGPRRGLIPVWIAPIVGASGVLMAGFVPLPPVRSGLGCKVGSAMTNVTNKAEAADPKFPAEYSAMMAQERFLLSL